MNGEWLTPGGQRAVISYREDTSDWNTISSCLQNPLSPGGDEYTLPAGLAGWGLDLGAHIGGVTVGLALDNPEMRVLAIEAVPENVDLLRENVAQNDLSDRVTIWHAAAWSDRRARKIEYDYSGSETATLHRFIGSVSPWLEDAPRRYVRVPSVTLADALALTDGQGFGWVKSDCEGCEHRFFRGPLDRLGVISGEWHHRDGSPEGFAAQLSATHDVTWTEGIGGGPFMAVPR